MQSRLDRHSPQVLAALPFELRSKILRHLYAGVIARVPLLQTMAHDDMFLTDVCVRLQHYTCTMDSYVYQRGVSTECHEIREQSNPSAVKPVCLQLHSRQVLIER